MVLISRRYGWAHRSIWMSAILDFSLICMIKTQAGLKVCYQSTHHHFHVCHRCHQWKWHLEGLQLSGCQCCIDIGLCRIVPLISKNFYMKSSLFLHCHLSKWWHLVLGAIHFWCVSVGHRRPCRSHYYSGLKKSCWAICAWSHTLAWIWTLRICRWRATKVCGSLSLFAMYLRKRCFLNSGILLIWIPSDEYEVHKNLDNVDTRSSVTSLVCESIFRTLRTS